MVRRRPRRDRRGRRAGRLRRRSRPGCRWLQLPRNPQQCGRMGPHDDRVRRPPVPVWRGRVPRGVRRRRGRARPLPRSRRDVGRRSTRRRRSSSCSTPSVRRSSRQRSWTRRSAIWPPASRTWSTWSTRSASCSAAGPDCCWASATCRSCARLSASTRCVSRTPRSRIELCELGRDAVALGAATLPVLRLLRDGGVVPLRATARPWGKKLRWVAEVSRRAGQTVHFWLAAPVQVQIWSGVALAELLPVTSRHLLACGFTRSRAAV